MPNRPRQKLVVANAINMVSEVNELIVHNARMGEETELVMPGMISRAYLVFHETGMVPMTDIDYDTETPEGA
jgi:hypothetical protein